MKELTSTTDDALRAVVARLVECNDKKYLNEDEVSELKQGILSMALENIRVEDKMTAHYGALNKVEQQLRTSEEMVTMREEALDFSELVESNTPRCKKDAQLKKMEKYKAVLNSLKDLNTDENAEIQVEVNTNDPRRFKCPLSTLTLVEPARNSLCNHVYSKEHILQHIKVDGTYFV